MLRRSLPRAIFSRATNLPLIKAPKHNPLQQCKHDLFSQSNDAESEDSACEGWSPGKERALIRKIDWKLLPTLCLIYLMAFLDR